ncbi:uncharacterized protein LOC123266045 [Cotesia glomerata]|uniref:uncharacterized protein LOC123266045 n=1 Tax=Cotesia glomerata TaxID=32391 RepID=UPI001D02F5B1|nr:uncharacterized protein LOC123266045 [Cotesia glomerata]
MGDSEKKKQEDALGTITQPAKCRACYHVMLSSDIVHCIKCSSGYHPLCAKNAGKLTNGAIQKCCGPKKNATVDDIKELLGRLRADINIDLQKTAENLRGSFEEATAKLGARIGAVEEKNTLIEKKVDDCQKNLEICTDSINVIGKKMQSLTSTEPNSQYACILAEVEERENRRKNVMVFDLAESTAATNAERVAHDNKAISNICAALDLSSAGFRSYRIESCGEKKKHRLTCNPTRNIDHERSNAATTISSENSKSRTQTSPSRRGSRPTSCDEEWILQCDRRETFRKTGGGVLISCNQIYDAKSINLDFITQRFPQIDAVGVEIGASNFICIIAVYIPPDLHSQIFADFLDCLSSSIIMDADSLMLIGDFNSPLFHAHFSSSSYSSKSELLLSFIALHNLNQFNNVLNTHGRTLDLVFSSTDCLVERVEYPIVKLDQYHPTLAITLQLNIEKRRSVSKKPVGAFNFHKYDKDKLITELGNIDWSPLLDNIDPDAKCKLFYKMLEKAFNIAIPRVKGTTYCTTLYPTWFSGDIIRECKLKDKYRRKLRQNPTPYHREQFKALRKSLKDKIRLTYNTHQQEIENNISKNPKCFWNYIKSKKQHNQFPTSFLIDNRDCSDPQQIANSFASFFSSVFNPLDTLPAYNNCGHKHLGQLKPPKESDVLDCIKKLPSKWSAGTDGIPCIIVKDCANVLTYPLTIIFESCISVGTFPRDWKEAKVCPIHKSGDKSNIKNYRPISIIPTFAKVFEMLLYDLILQYFKPIVSPSQHGFYSKRSTVTNLLPYTQYLYDSLAEGSQVDVIHTDFAKAFDRVDISRLIDALNKLGLPELLIKMLRSYLLGRLNVVLYNGYLSVPYPTTSGVPQGSNLGPLLFIIFINSIGNHISCFFDLFADDAKYYLAVRSVDDCVYLQRNLDVVAAWCRDNKLHLNEEKCKVISFSRSRNQIRFDYKINGVVLQRVSCCRDLGVNFDSKLAFSQHYRSIALSATKTLGFVIRATKDFKNLNTIKLLFESLVRPKLEYAALVWSPTYKRHIMSLEKVQRRFLKYLSWKKNGTYPAIGIDYLELCADAGVLTLEERRSCAAILFVKNLFRGFVDCSKMLETVPINVPSRINRTKLLLRPKVSRTNFSQSSPLHRLIAVCNQIDQNGNCEVDILAYNQPLTSGVLASMITQYR